MRDLTRQGRFFEKVVIEGGATTRAVVQRTSDTDAPGIQFANPKTILRVRPNSILRPGQVVRLKGEDRFLLAHHSATGGYRTLHAFQADRQLPWTRISSETNVVSKQKMSAEPVKLGDIWVMWERTRQEFTDLSLRIGLENYLVATGSDVQLGDYVGGLLVKRVNQALEIKILELQT